jgi:hypothetical protein
MSRGKVIEDPSLSAKVAAKKVELAEAELEDMTVADRLTRRALSQPTITIDIGDDDTPDLTEVMLPAMVEVDYLSTLQVRLEAVKTIQEYTAVMSEAAEILGRLCLDPSLDADFWRSGLFPTEVLFGVIKEISAAAIDRIKSARAFRPKTQRAGAA